MSPLGSHGEQIMWRKSLALASEVYAATRNISAPGEAALVSETRHAATALASAVAEACACGNRLESMRFLQLARSSMADLATRICIARELGLFGADAALDRQIAETGDLLAQTHRRLREHRERARGFHAVPTRRR